MAGATKTSGSDQLQIQEHEAELRVARREEVAEGVITLVLADPAGGELPEWTPGAHVDLLLGDGLVRQYSLCGGPGDSSEWRVGVLLDPDSRGGSRFVHERLQQGDTVRVRGPRNHFSVVEVPSYLFVAGGIGITPILPMIEVVAGRGADWQLLYGGRSRNSMAFLDELQAHGERVTICPQDEQGLLDLPALLGEPRPDTAVYCCGPEPLLAAVEDACKPWPSGALHVERFAAKAAPEQSEAPASFEVVAQRSGVTVSVDTDQSILEALEDAGVSVLASCCEGICGTCETPVIDGEPEHRDSVLSESEREASDVMMVCISRARSERLVLDV